MVKKIKKLRESEEDIEIHENDDEMAAVREACKKIHEEADEIKENEEMDLVFGDIKESLENIKESLDKLVNEDEEELDEEEEEKTIEEEVEEIKESLDKLVNSDSNKLDEEDENKTCLSEEEVEEIKESLDKLVNEDEELNLEEVEEIKESLDKLEESLEKMVEEDEEEKLNEEDEEKLDEDEDEKLNEEDEELDEDEEKETIEESVKRVFGKMRLSESVKKNIVTLIEAKVKEETEEKIKELEQKAEEYGDYLKTESEEELQQKMEELEDKADAYLSDVVEEWAEENKLAIEDGIKSEIAESVMLGIKKVLKENNINIPENKSNLLEETLAVNKKLQTKINEKLASIAKLQEENRKLLKYKIIEENSRDLSLMQKNKLSNLLENVRFSSTNELVKKINVLKENYLSTYKSEGTVNRKNVSSSNNLYDSYANFIQKSVK